MLKLILVTLTFLLSLSADPPEDPAILYLSWQRDPAHTMTIQWHSSHPETSPLIHYKKEGDAIWLSQKGSCEPLYKKSPPSVYTVELTDLEPDAEYKFFVDKGWMPYRFRTLPIDPKHPLRFIVGGDAYLYLASFQAMNAQMAKQDPNFIIVGGDIAYSRTKHYLLKTDRDKVERWETFLKIWKTQMITSDGRLIPLLPVLGNHDTKKTSNQSPSPSDGYFYKLFAMPEKEIPYRALEIGTLLSLVILDSGHNYPIAGKQTQWLKKTLNDDDQFPYKLAIYHVAAYPSWYSYDAPTPTKIRKNWVPLFEDYHVQAAFEHHNHAYKSTHRLKQGKIDPEGVLYLGDGCWGVHPRRVKPASDSWYLAKTAPVNSFWLVTLDKDKCLFQSFDLKGNSIETIEAFPFSH